MSDAVGSTPSELNERLSGLSLHTAASASTTAIVADVNEQQQQELTQAEASSFESQKPRATPQDITYRNYRDEDDIDIIVNLVAPSLSEPYSVYCYRYFLHGW
jgi:hypothetical protein